ncbi:sigma-70 family RNA polymerase sigma factor [Gemmata sp. JC717]|uniref:RNA polymerase sigma factor n=1 Tax=Gemmata algarum TaxID=2975278 RepID=UPI0021BB3066|nr:sigma-70 family RNA polymerase sigma factor [Gemmata algarum]MDY3555808.1 sigma-70 family RNA polymerase sigma factor [Gemmata algarum]
MSVTRPTEILRRLEPAAAPDGELLARFAAHRDQNAFTELVRRHGGMVLGVCQRVTRSRADAEDAFQAVFLVLAKKADAVRDTKALGSWLYGVAYRVALRSRQAAGRRRAREVTMPILPDCAGPDPNLGSTSDLAAALDRELAALPSRYRDAIVLCDLQGASREDAAAALGVPEGTLSSRLANGRKKLAARLTKRGVVLSIAVLPLALAEVRGATVVSKELVLCTGTLVADVAAGGAVPRAVAHLLNGGSAVRKMLIVSVALVAAAAGAVLAAHPGVEPPQKGPRKPPAVADKAVQPLETKEQPKPLLDKVVTFTTAPNLVRAADLRLSHVRAAFWNDAGTHLAVLGSQPTDPVGLAVHGGQPRGRLWLQFVRSVSRDHSLQPFMIRRSSSGSVRTVRAV